MRMLPTRAREARNVIFPTDVLVYLPIWCCTCIRTSMHMYGKILTDGMSSVLCGPDSSVSSTVQ
jgi:hypothetical protein